MKRLKIIKNDPGSFKDPTGGVFYYKDKVFRWISKENGQFYLDISKSEIFEDLVRSKYIVPTWPADIGHDLNLIEKYGDDIIYFEHEPIEFLSFPYEWPASMILDSAFHTLDFQSLRLQKGLSLKDATPYNIQYCSTQPLFIDFCSIENASQNGVWIAYNQFCQNFLYPMLMFQFKTSRLSSIYLSHINGLSLDETVRALGFRPFFKYGMIIDYLLPALIVKLNQLKLIDINKKTVSTSKTLKNSIEIQLHTVRRLKKQLNKLRLKRTDSDWLSYPNSCSYSEKDSAIKERFVEKTLQNYDIKTVLDLGSNIGNFSMIAAKNGCEVVALDSDHHCIDHLYDCAKENNYSILPLCIDIVNPSPSIGWFNKERPGFLKRMDGRFDCVFALALIHHLIISSRIPLKEIVKLFYRCASRFLIVEYVSPSDTMFKELLKYRSESYADFNMVNFERAFDAKFSLIEKKELFFEEEGMRRCLYLMEKK